MDSLNFENLVSTMNLNAEKLYKDMNLQSDAIIINQQDTHYYNEYNIDNKLLREYGFAEKGVGLSRNNALQRARADICIMSDDDMVYTENYLSKINMAYKKNPDADMIIFNVRIHDENGITEKVKNNERVHFLNSLKYGTVTFTFKRSPVLKNRISFSLLFGGGAPFSNGEDSLFLWDCLKRGLKVYSSTEIIADVYNFSSTWFEGYTNNFFIDRGALFEALSSKYSLFLIYQYAIRKRKLFEEKYSVNEAITLMKKGRSSYKNINKLNN